MLTSSNDLKSSRGTGEEFMVEKLPIVGISMGDPGGIGPEICVKALALEEMYGICRPIVVGDAGVMRNAVEFSRLALGVKGCGSVAEAGFRPGTVDVFDLKN